MKTTGSYGQHNNLWWIPLTYTTASKLDFSVTKPSHWLKAEDFMMITEAGVSPHDWVLFNVNETGFYRVNYDLRNWQMLISYLNDPELFYKIGKYTHTHTEYILFPTPK